mgnify:CR=1 FL=1
MQLETYSIGVGDRLAKQGEFQLAACERAREDGIPIVPVWNKSHREHEIVGSKPGGVRAEADAAVSARGWPHPYHVDADHIGLDNVGRFMSASDFFTLDVADFTGRMADADAIDAFVDRFSGYAGTLSIPGIPAALEITVGDIREIAGRFLLAVQEAGRIYRHIAARKGEGTFVTEVSMDETETAQTPRELFFILAAIAAEGIPAQTIAPKFSGRFNKGVDYVGDPDTFAAEFDQDLAVVAFAIAEFGLPASLKLSVHSGSDKFSIYPAMNAALRRHAAGLHLKTAGTTWLEELIGLASAGDEGLRIAQEIYRGALERFDELCAPYAPVLDIDKAALPSITAASNWDGKTFAAALRHDPGSEVYNPHFRQLLHVSYKIAAEMGDRYVDALASARDTVGENVTENLYLRHIRPIFSGQA